MSPIELNIDVPKHTKELSHCQDITYQLAIEFKSIGTKLTDEKFIHLYEENSKVLFYLGHLSEAIFSIAPVIERAYDIAYSNSPQLSKKLWYEHYENYHRPYTLLKNKCWRFFDELDTTYIKINKTFPPNWDVRLYEPLQEDVMKDTRDMPDGMDNDIDIDLDTDIAYFIDRGLEDESIKSKLKKKFKDEFKFDEPMIDEVNLIEDFFDDNTTDDDCF